MKHFSIIAVFSFFISATTYGQVIDLIDNSKALPLPITKFTSYYSSSEQIPVDSIENRYSKFIKAGNTPVLVFNYSPYYYWFRIIVSNKTSKDFPVFLIMAPTGMIEGVLYQKTNRQWNEASYSGLKYRFRDRSYQFAHYTFPVTIKSQTTDTLLLYINGLNLYKSFGFSLHQPKGIKAYENKIYLVFGIIIGLLLLFFVLNLSLFFAIKDRLHLWYSVYILLLIVIVMKNDQLDQEFLGLDSESGFRYTPYLAIGSIAIAILMHVVNMFLYPVLSKQKMLLNVNKVVKSNIVLSSMVHALVFISVQDYKVQNFILSWTKISALLATALIVINCLFCMLKGAKYALFPLLGSTVFLYGSMQRIFAPSTLSFLFPPTTFHIGIILEVFIISLGLIYRYWWERELQRKKEIQFQQTLLKVELEIQEQTLKNISQEIHDNIGQGLTLAKLNLNTMPPVDAGVHEKLINTKELVSKAIVDLRNLSHSLDTDYIADMGLHQAIEYELKRISESSAIPSSLHTTGEPFPIDQQKQLILFRIVQEVLNNTLKHAVAQSITATIEFGQHEMKLSITDDGKGFDPNAVRHTTGERGLGLRSMQNRAKLIGAKFSMESIPGNGTTVQITLGKEAVPTS